MPDTKEEGAKILASFHYRVTDGITDIFRLVAPAGTEALPGEPIKLLEVNRNTVPSGVMPLQFGPVPARGVHHPSVIVEITPEEFGRLQAQELALPDGWSIGPRLDGPTADRGE